MSSDLRKWLNLWTVLGLLLLGFELWVFTLARNPDVSEAYRAYYIDRSSDLPVWLAEGGADHLEPVEIGREYAHSDPRFAFSGWSSPEETHVWTLGHDAELLFVLPDAADAGGTLTLVLRGTYLNGHQDIGVSGAAEPFSRTYRDGEEIDIPLPRASGQRTVHISLHLPNAASPGPRDPRVLGFALRGLRVENRP